MFRTATRMLLPARIQVLAVLAVALITVDASQINWRSPSNRNNVTSEGQPLGAGFIFELGCFNDGFVPTEANASQWSAEWEALDRTGYRSSDRMFSSSVVVLENRPPFSIGKRTYIWGYDSLGSGQMILLGGTDWFIPAPSAISFPTTWVATNNAEVIVGTVGSTSDTEFIRTAPVLGEIPLVLPETWRDEAFLNEDLSNEAVSSWEADPDLDGLSNFHEYLFGLDPKRFDADYSVELLVEDSDAQLRLELDPRRLGQATVLISTDLGVWMEPTAIGGTTEFREMNQIRVVSQGDVNRLFYSISVEWPFGILP